MRSISRMSALNTVWRNRHIFAVFSFSNATQYQNGNSADSVPAHVIKRPYSLNLLSEGIVVIAEQFSAILDRHFDDIPFLYRKGNCLKI